MNDSDDFKPLALLNQLKFTVIDSGVLSNAQHSWLISLSEEISNEDFLDIEEFSLVLDEIEYQCFFVMRKLISEKETLAKRFSGQELPELYFKGLMKILDPDNNNSIE